MRVRLMDGWHVRSNQDGVELMAPEHNFSLELSDLSYREQLIAVLKGNEEVPEENEAIQTTLYQLEQAGVVSRQYYARAQEQQPSAIEKAVERIRRELVGKRGPVTGVYWLDPKQSRLAISQTHLFTAKYEERTGQNEETEEGWASGSDADWELAEFKAIMEALERHASGVIPREQLVKSTARKLKDQALDPRSVVVYTQAQYRSGLPYTRFSQRREYWWKSASVFPEGTEKYLPAECLYYPVPQELAPNLYTQASSSGVAAGLTFEDALLRGLHEAIERDAFMLVWLNRMSMPRVDFQAVPGGQQVRIRQLESLGYTAHLVDITLDFAPVVLVVAASDSQCPALALGAASNWDLERAVEKALSEVEHQLYWEWRNPENVRSITDPREVHGVLDHMALYASQEHLSKAAFLWQGKVKDPKKWDLSAQDVWSLIENLEEHGIATAVLDLTPPYLKNAGVWVVRAIPIGLVPISFGYGMEPLGMERYKLLAGQRRNSWGRRSPFTHPFA